MTVPPQVREVAEQLAEQVFAARGTNGAVWITGQPGTGKTVVLDHLHHLAVDRRWPVIRLSPSSSDLDGPANAIAQGAASLIEHGVNGALDRVFDPTASFYEKLDAFGRSLVAAEDSLILIDMPDSWARPSRSSHDGGTFAFQGAAVVREVLGQRNGHRLVMASRRSPPDGRDIFELSRGGGMQMLPGSTDADFDWGRCQAAAAELRREVPERDLAKLTPLATRVAVALSALELDPLLLRNACRAGLPMLRSMLQVQARRYGWLREALFVLSHARISVGERLLGELLGACDGGDEPRSRAVLEDAILLRESSGWVLHPRLRALDLDFDRDRARELADRSNRQLAQAWAQAWAPGENRRSWAGVIAWWESLHHWAEAGEDSRLDQVPDVSMWTTLGRRLSLRGDYAAAVQAFRRAVDLQPDDSYAHEYLAYNLDGLGERREESERSFRRAVELDPANPWWNRRLVQALQRRGKIEDAWDAWLAALDGVEGTTDPSEWLQEHLFHGVCRGFLERGEATLAAEVLGAVPREQWIPAFHELHNVVLHRSEAERLEASLFPEDLEFDQRWSGPHLGEGDEPQTWFPGRVVALDEVAGVVELELAEPPEADEEPEVFGLTLDIADFVEQAELPTRMRPRLDQLLELHVYADGEQRIFLHLPPRPMIAGGGRRLDLLSSFRP
jgi:tetratricopeptide (TPR) repeat protein